MSNNKTNQNEPAFSCTDGNKFYDPGLTKREYFAAIALQGILGHEKLYHSDGFLNPCIDAVKMADELIKALNNED
jgi:hypothetical protein